MAANDEFVGVASLTANWQKLYNVLTSLVDAN